uniref:Xrn1 N-terminal domain-containing protein n=1 Tax=viral metagenome TaxID=1070528 RepID=A0A6C0K7D9_9ZZZZ
MGIPTFFRSILQKNRRLIRGAVQGGEEFDYFFIDFNSLVYNTWNKIQRSLSSSDQDETIIHDRLIEATVEKVLYMVNEIVCPAHYVFISMDGVAPRAKMVQQRSRRYKSVQLKEVMRAKRAELDMANPIEWDPSPNICPGTVFMEKMGLALRVAMKANRFHSQVLLSDVGCPGEGEHKFLKRIRMIHADPQTRDASVVVYSPDGDMISLSLLTHKSQIHIMRIPDKESLHESRFCKDFEFIYCDLDALRKDFFNQLTVTYRGEDIDELRILNDYNFLLFMVGNDFVPSLPFLKIRSGGLDLLIGIYNRLRPEIREYLIDYDPLSPATPRIHPVFFERLIVELSKTENREMQQETEERIRHMGGNLSGKTRKMEEGMTPFQVFESRYQHMCFFSPHHPEAHRYAHLATLIDYRRPKHEWKAKYYEYFLGIDAQNMTAYNEGRTQIVVNYLESLVFTLRYYLQGCPSYDWHYRYRVSPLPSDIFSVLSRFRYDINNIVFPASQPFSPMEQLCFILPPQMSFLLPLPLREILSDRESYPTEFEVDALAGSKYIYSEAILPELDTEALKAKIRARISLLNANEQKRNLSSTRLVYLKKKKSSS